jgi:YD repeat-containing protein
VIVVGAVVAVAVVVAAAAVLLAGDDEPISQTRQEPGEPTPFDAKGGSPQSPSPEPTTDAAGGAGSLASDAQSPALAAEAPAALFAAGPQGLERVDARRGERAVVVAADESRESVSFPAGVDVWPSGDRVAIDMCCEPVPGSTYTAAATGEALGEATLLHSGGIFPAVGPEGQRIALSTQASGRSIVIVDTDGERIHEITGQTDAPGVGEIAWSPDGQQLAFEWGGEDAGVWVVDADAADLDDAREVARGSQAVFESPAFRADGMLVVTESDPPAVRNMTDQRRPEGESTGIVLDPATGQTLASFDYEGRALHQDYDASGRYLAYSLSDGRVRWRGGGDAGEILPADSQLSALAW